MAKANPKYPDTMKPNLQVPLIIINVSSMINNTIKIFMTPNNFNRLFKENMKIKK